MEQSYSIQLLNLILRSPPQVGVSKDGPMASWFETRSALLTMRSESSHMPDFFRHVVKRRMAVDLGLSRLEHHALLGRIGCGDRTRRHHPDREPLAAAGEDVARRLQ